MSGLVHGGGITEAAAAYGGRVEDWLDLSTGINPNPVALPDIPMLAWHRLPDQYLIDAAQDAAVGYYRSGPVVPLAVPGTQSVIQLLPRMVEPGSRIAIFGPTYGEYARVFSVAGFAVDEISSPDELTTAHGLAVVVNPNNPTGRAYTVDVILSMAMSMKAHGGLLVVDEAFGDTQPDLTVAPFVAEQDNLVVLRSFGKFFGLAGLRLGFVIAGQPVVSALRSWLGPWAVSGPALVVAGALLESDCRPLQSAIVARKSALNMVLQRAGVTILGGTALFTLIQSERAAELHLDLCRARILTRKFDYAPSWLRIGLAPDTTGDARLADALRLAGSG